jgi:hypothetical protein
VYAAMRGSIPGCEFCRVKGVGEVEGLN